MRFLAALMALLASTLVFAHGPSRLKANETITLKASPDVVWAKVKDFTQLQAWHPAIESSTATAGSEVGSVRTLKVKGGGEVIEKLEKISDEERSLIYTAQDGGARPVAGAKWSGVRCSSASIRETTRRPARTMTRQPARSGRSTPTV